MDNSRFYNDGLVTNGAEKKSLIEGQKGSFLDDLPYLWEILPENWLIWVLMTYKEPLSKIKIRTIS